MGVRLRSRDQTAKRGMAHEKFSSSEESTHEQIQGENHNYCFFFFFPAAVVLCTKNLYLQDRQLITPSTKMSWNDFEKGSNESERTLQTIGCCNTITRHLTLRFQFLAKKNIPVLPHPLYSPDLAPCDFCLFRKLKSKLKDRHFGTMENIQKIVTDELHTLTENDFQYCYDQWKKRWSHCVTSQGSYFEGDNL